MLVKNVKNFDQKTPEQQLLAMGWRWTGFKWIDPMGKEWDREKAIETLSANDR